MRSAAGRKREINIARRSGELGSGMRRGTGGWGPHRGLELELDGSPARKIHIFKYFSHGPQSPRHAALPPTLPAAHYVPTTYQVRAWASPRVRRAVSGFLVTRCRFLSVSLPLSFVTILFCILWRATRECACVSCIARLHVYRRAFAGRNASTASGNVTAATVSAVEMSSLMSDVEDGDNMFKLLSDAFPNHHEYLISEKKIVY